MVYRFFLPRFCSVNPSTDAEMGSYLRIRNLFPDYTEPPMKENLSPFKQFHRPISSMELACRIFNLFHTVQHRALALPNKRKLISLTPDFEASSDWKIKSISNIFSVEEFSFLFRSASRYIPMSEGRGKNFI